MQRWSLLASVLILLGFSALVPSTLVGQVLHASDLPAVVIRGLDAYKAKGAGAGVSPWLAGSPAGKDSSNIPRMVEGLQSVAQAYGKMTGYDLLRVTQNWHARTSCVHRDPLRDRRVVCAIRMLSSAEWMDRVVVPDEPASDGHSSPGSSRRPR
jgi:hypothetical protein